MNSFVKAKPVSLKNHADYREKWLQDLIVDDPTILGLGDLTVKDVERRQPRAGRLDLLLHDPESDTRYEVELQLGATDESHIIRTIEYWDIENNRYPMYDHVAVIVAEDVTSRFLNVISLLNKNIPIIAIQINAWQIGDSLTVTATKVLDLALVGTDEDDEGNEQTVDRTYWEQKASPESMHVLDQMLQLIHEATGDASIQPKYNRNYVRLNRGGQSLNFFIFRPRKSDYVHTELKVPRSDELAARMEDSGLDVDDYKTRYGYYPVRLRASDFTKRRDLLIDIIQRASGLKPALEETTPASTD